MRKTVAGSTGRAALRSSAIALVLLASAGAANAQAVSRVIVEGNQRIDDQTVRDYLTIKPGQAATASRLDDSLKALFATGLFEDVELTRQGGALIVRVTENAVINAINVEGNRRIKDDAIEAVIQSRSQGALSRNQVQADVQRVLDLYRARGRFNATVTPQVIPVGQGRVNLAFVVQEGRKVGVKRINFIGNDRYGDGTLRSKLRTTESNLLSFLKTSDVYNPAVFEADQEALRKFYLNNGYADFRIISAVADYDAADEAFYITYTIEEGDRYEIGAVDIESNIVNLPGEELRREVRTDPGDRYSAEDVDKTLEDMTLAVAEKGYAFGQVRPRGFRDPQTDRVNITYVVEEGPRVYVERINIVGNTRTQDFVIRREFDLAEGDAFNRVLVDRAKRRLEQPAIFQIASASPTRPAPPPTASMHERVRRGRLDRQHRRSAAAGPRSATASFSMHRPHGAQLPRAAASRSRSAARSARSAARSISRSPSPISSGDGSRPASTCSIASRTCRTWRPTTTTSTAGACASACRSPRSLACPAALPPLADRHQATCRTTASRRSSCNTTTRASSRPSVGYSPRLQHAR